MKKKKIKAFEDYINDLNGIVKKHGLGKTLEPFLFQGLLQIPDFTQQGIVFPGGSRRQLGRDAKEYWQHFYVFL